MNLSQLASELRENGDQVLNGASKLSLSTKLLNELNESFSFLIEEREALNSTFQVISGSNSKVELLLDLQFLHDFIQRTVALKLVEENTNASEPCNINKFKNLKLLELRKISVVELIGLQSLRTQLRYIICIRGLNNLKELFVNCGGDKSQGFVWTELKEAVLTYNNLKYVDKSFEYVPWLQILDLSHNSIEDAQPLDCLTNLKQLNLSFNHLETLPIFKLELSRNLQVLLLKSNFIEDLMGLQFLDNLTTLDLSCNCLIDHQCLNPLIYLAALQWLNLEGNPLSFHPNHRTYTAQFLHSNIASVQFILDREVLSKSERLQIGTFYTTVAGKFVLYGRRTYQSSITSSFSEVLNSCEAGASSELVRSQTYQKGRKIRTAVIAEKEEQKDMRDDKGDIISPELLKSYHSAKSVDLGVEPSSSTNEKIENLRKEYGEYWLKRQSGSLMQDILGMQKSASPELASTPYEEDFIKHAVEIYHSKVEVSEDPVVIPIPDTDADKADVISDLSANNTFVTASESSVFEEKDLPSESISSSSDDEEIEDGEERLYVAQNRVENAQNEEIFIVITNSYIKERDANNGRTRCKWLLDVIVSCEIISNNPPTVRMEFDTVRRNMKQREYILEEQEAKSLLRNISDITSKRTLSAMNQVVYCCMKCWSQFSQEKDVRVSVSENTGSRVCPNCKSTMVYEMDDEQTPTNKDLGQNIPTKPTERGDSPSECSIASENGESEFVEVNVSVEVHTESKLPTSLPSNSSAVSVQESVASRASEEDSRSTDIVTRKCESDIEVISNPSQSSIEVLDDQYKPIRKRSSEERRTIITPSLVTIPDVVVPLCAIQPVLGLTESSSSSSYTESICTAYDAQTVHISRPSSSLEVKPTIQEQHELSSNKTDEDRSKNKLISSIFEGLFSGPTVGTKSTASTKNANDIQFSFSEDFSNIDHRIKYYLYQSIFEDEHENFVWLLKCIILSSNLKQPENGCLVLSTHRVYILHIKHFHTDEDISSWLVKKDSYTIDRLQIVFSLPWKQGVGIEIRNLGKDPTQYLCILQDVERTSNFLAFLTGNPLPDSCDLQCTPPERPVLNLQQLLLSSTSDHTKDPTLRMLAIFTKCCVIDSETKTVSMGVFIATSCDLILLADVAWLLPDSNLEPKVFQSQPISNLLEVDIEDVSLDLHYLDEVESCEQIWSIQFETVASVKTVLSAIQQPWENMFSVSLQINCKS